MFANFDRVYLGRGSSACTESRGRGRGRGRGAAASRAAIPPPSPIINDALEAEQVNIFCFFILWHFFLSKINSFSYTAQFCASRKTLK